MRKILDDNGYFDMYCDSGTPQCSCESSHSAFDLIIDRVNHDFSEENEIRDTIEYRDGVPYYPDN